MNCFFCNKKIKKINYSISIYNCSKCNVDHITDIISDNIITCVINLNMGLNNFCLDYYFDYDICKLRKEVIRKRGSYSYHQWETIQKIPCNVIRDKTLNEIHDKMKKYIILN